MKTGVIFCYLLAGIVLCIGTASGTVISLSTSDADKLIVMISVVMCFPILHTHMLKSAHNFAHSDKTERNKAGAPQSFSSVGENVLASTGNIDYQLFVDYWGTEKQHYSYPNCNIYKECGHYTQVRCEMYHACMYIGRYIA